MQRLACEFDGPRLSVLHQSNWLSLYRHSRPLHHSARSIRARGRQCLRRPRQARLRTAVVAVEALRLRRFQLVDFNLTDVDAPDHFQQLFFLSAESCEKEYDTHWYRQ